MRNITNQELEILKTSMLGEFGLYKIIDGIPKTVYISAHLNLACGMTRDEFLARTGEDAMAVVLPSDKQQIMQDIRDCVQHGREIDARYRVKVKDKGSLWVRARGKVCGIMDGAPLLLVSYASEMYNANSFMAILNNLDCKVYICDRYTKELLYANKEAMKFASADADITRHMTCHKFFMNLEEPCADCILPQLNNAPVSREKYLEKKQMWLHVNVTPIVLGKHEAFAIYVRDITKQKQKQAQYKKSIQNLLDTIPDSLGTFMLNGTKGTCSEGFGREPQFIEAINASTIEGLKVNVLKLIPDSAQRNLVNDILNKERALAAFEQGKTDLSCEYQIALKKSDRRWVKTEIHMFSNPETGDIEGVAYTHDITAAKKKKLIYDIITSREFDLIALIHLDSGLYETIFFGKNLSETIKQYLPAVGDKVDFNKYCSFALQHWIVSAQGGSYKHKANLSYVRSQIAKADYYEFTYAMLNEDGKVIYHKKQHHRIDDTTVLVLESDVTNPVEQHQKQVKREKVLRQAAETANNIKTEFLSRVSHDMRTPLNGIIGMSYLTQKMALPTVAKANLQRIDTSSRFLLDLINEILDLNKIENNKLKMHMEPVYAQDYHNYLESIIKPLCDEKNQKLLVSIKLPEDYVALNDKMIVARLAFNLLSNASKYTPEGGTISCTVRGKVLPGENQIAKRIAVSDNGIGMSEAFQQVMFEPFTQANEHVVQERHGSGLGLAIVKKLVDMIHGSIKVQSALGKGTTITIDVVEDCLPTAMLEKQQNIAGNSDNVGTCLAGKRVLCCEDHQLNTLILVNLLKSKGMLIDTAGNGAIGVQKFKESPLNNYDAILMDIRMPIMDGYEAAKEIRKLTRPDAATIPIIALSANAFAEDKQKSLEAGMNNHLAKPIEPQKLYETLVKVL